LARFLVHSDDIARANRLWPADSPRIWSHQQDGQFPTMAHTCDHGTPLTITLIADMGCQNKHPRGCRQLQLAVPLIAAGAPQYAHKIPLRPDQSIR